MNLKRKHICYPAVPVDVGGEGLPTVHLIQTCRLLSVQVPSQLTPPAPLQPRGCRDFLTLFDCCSGPRVEQVLWVPWKKLDLQF